MNTQLQENIALHAYDKLEPEKTTEEELREGVLFKKCAYHIPSAISPQMVNIYAMEVKKGFNRRFGMCFDDSGEYCVNLAKRAETKSQNKVIAAMNCNFGFVITDPTPKPQDCSFNLRLEDGILKQFPVADKTACLIDREGAATFRFLKAHGRFRIKNQDFDWIGSLSKTPPKDHEIILYNSFNCRIVQVPDPTTRTKKVVDESSVRPLSRKNHTVITVGLCKRGLYITSANKEGHPSVLEHLLIMHVPDRFAEAFMPGELINNVTLDDVTINSFEYGCSVGAILTPSAADTASNIAASAMLQTTTPGGGVVYSKEDRFARACFIRTKTAFVFLLADARAHVKGQEGMTITELRRAIATLYPDFEQAVNVDGGNAPKIVLGADGNFAVYGNLHYKIWPQSSDECFRWDGYRGRKVPGLIYIY